MPLWDVASGVTVGAEDGDGPWMIDWSIFFHLGIYVVAKGVG